MIPLNVIVSARLSQKTGKANFDIRRLNPELSKEVTGGRYPNLFMISYRHGDTAPHGVEFNDEYVIPNGETSSYLLLDTRTLRLLHKRIGAVLGIENKDKESNHG